MKSILKSTIAGFLLVALATAGAYAQPQPDTPQTLEDDMPQIKEATDEPVETEEQARSWRELARTSDPVLASFTNVVQNAKSATVRVLSSDEQIAMGTIVDANGLILTKASEMRGELECELDDGRKFPAKVFGIDRKTDLTLLKIEASNLPVISWSDKDSILPIGTWLATPDNKPKPIAAGVVSVVARRVVPGGVLGVYLEDHEKGIRIDRVITGSPAELVDIRVNDVIIAVNGMKTETRESLIQKVKQYAPGDRIELKALRNGKEITFRPVLGRRTVLEEKGERSRSNIQNSMGSTLSTRRTGFDSVIQHDSMLAPNQCGGVVVDLSGKAVGLNIARSGRIMSFALPATVVLPVLTKLLNGEFSPEVVNKERLKLIEEELKELDSKEKNLPTEQGRMEKEVEKLEKLIAEFKKEVADAQSKIDKAAEALEKSENQRNDLARELRTGKRLLRKIDSTREDLKKEREALLLGTLPETEKD